MRITFRGDWGKQIRHHIRSRRLLGVGGTSATFPKRAINEIWWTLENIYKEHRKIAFAKEFHVIDFRA